MMFDCTDVSKKNCGCCEYLNKVVRDYDDCFIRWECLFSDLDSRKKHCIKLHRYSVVVRYYEPFVMASDDEYLYLIKDNVNNSLLFELKYDDEKIAKAVCDALNWCNGQ